MSQLIMTITSLRHAISNFMGSLKKYSSNGWGEKKRIKPVSQS